MARQKAGRAGWILAGLLVAGVVLTLAHRLSADEGQILSGGWSLYNGARIYEDFFEFIGPASFAWVHVFFRALGPHYTAALVAAWVLLFVGLGMFVASAYLMSERTAPVVVMSIAWLFFSTMPPFINHNSFSASLALGFAYFMLRVLSSGRAWAAFAAGAMAAATFFFLQPKGAVLLVVGLASLAWTSRRRSRDSTGEGSSAAIVAYIVGVVLVLAWGAALWGIHPVTSLLTVASGNMAMNHRSISYLPLFAGIALALLAALACLRTNRLDRRVAFLLALQAGLWMSTIHLPDLWHLTINSFPLLLVFARLGGVRAEGKPGRSTAIAWVLIVIALVAAADAIVRNVEDTRATRAWLAELNAILEGKDFFAFTFLPSFYLELQVPNPYYNSVLFEGSHPRDHFRRNVERLSVYRPEYVIADYATVAKYGHTGQNAVDRFIRRHYRRIKVLPHASGRLEIWQALAGSQ